MHKHGTLGNANSRDRQEECEGSREKDQRGPRRRGRSREKRKVQGTGRHSSCRRTARREPGHRNQRAGRGDIRLGVPVGPLYDRAPASTADVGFPPPFTASALSSPEVGRTPAVML